MVSLKVKLLESRNFYRKVVRIIRTNGEKEYLDAFVVGVVFFFELDFSGDGLGELLFTLVDSGNFTGSHSSEESVGDLLVLENLVESRLKSSSEDLGQHLLWI